MNLKIVVKFNNASVDLEWSALDYVKKSPFENQAFEAPMADIQKRHIPLLGT